MKLSILATISLLSLSLLSTLSNAEDRKHSFGLVTGIANGEYKNSSQDGNGFAQAYLFYNYQVIEDFSIEVAYNTATELTDWDCDEISEDRWTCGINNKPMFGLLADEFESDSFIIALKGQAPLSKRNSLYAKLGAEFYDYKFTRNDFFIEGDSGTGTFLEAGWQYQWDLGIGMNSGLRYQKLGSLTFKSINVGINYAF